MGHPGTSIQHQFIPCTRVRYKVLDIQSQGDKGLLTSAYKIIVVIYLVNIEWGSLIRPNPRFPLKELKSVFIEFAGKLSNRDIHRADPFTGPAVRASSGAVIGPQKMKSHGIRRVNAFPHPLWLRLIHKTGGTITEGTGIATGITTDARGNELCKELPFFLVPAGWDNYSLQPASLMPWATLQSTTRK